MTRGRMLLTLLLATVSGSALAQTATQGGHGYGPSLQGSGTATAPAAQSDTPGPAAPLAGRITRPNPIVTSSGTATLNDALAQVYLTNPALLGERAHLRSIDENVPAALSGWRPQVSVTVSPGWGFGTITNSNDITIPGTNQFVLDSKGEKKTIAVVSTNTRYALTEQAQFSQPLYRGGRTTAGTAQAENQVRAERAALVAQEEQTFSDGVTGFVTVIEDQQLYELNVSNVQVLTKDLEATNARFSVGEITRTDVAQAQAALAQAVAERETAFGTLQTARATYRQTIGELPDKLIEPQPLALQIKSVDEADTLASVNNASVVGAMYNDAAAQDAVDVAFSALMPQVNITMSGGYNRDAAFRGNHSTQAVLGGQITVPIYQGGSEYAAIRQARQNEQMTRNSVDQTRRAAVQQATQYWETFIADKATVASTRAEIRADEIALDGVEREALAGTQTTLDVLNAEQALLSARVTLVQNLAGLVTASYQVAGATGRLTARDLGLNVPFYDDTAYYHAVRGRGFGTGDYATDQPGR